MAYAIDLYISRNTDFVYTFVARDFQGNTINLTGFSVFAEYSTGPLAATTPFTGIIITNPVLGEIQVTVSAADTLAFQPYYRYLFTVGVITPTGSRINIAEGVLHIRGNV